MRIREELLTRALERHTAQLDHVGALRESERERPVLLASADREELLVKGGHVGIVVGRAAKQELWPKVGDWLRRHDA